jgi:hypothetical protein
MLVSLMEDRWQLGAHLNTTSEYRPPNPKQIRSPKAQMTETAAPLWVFRALRHSIFGFASDFGFRIYPGAGYGYIREMPASWGEKPAHPGCGA